MMFRALRRFLGSFNRSAQLLAEIRDGVANQSSLINDKMRALDEGQRSQVNELKNIQKQLAQLLERK